MSKEKYDSIANKYIEKIRALKVGTENTATGRKVTPFTLMEDMANELSLAGATPLQVDSYLEKCERLPE